MSESENPNVSQSTPPRISIHTIRLWGALSSIKATDVLIRRDKIAEAAGVERGCEHRLLTSLAMAGLASVNGLVKKDGYEYVRLHMKRRALDIDELYGR